MNKPAHALIVAPLLLIVLTGCQQVEHSQPGKDPKAVIVTPAAATTPARSSGSCDRRIFKAEALKKGVKVLAGVAAEGESMAQWKLLEEARAFEGKTVRVEGPIVSICQGSGCWIAIRGPRRKLVDLKVDDDGAVDFRKIARVGQYAVGEGVFSTATGRGRVKITGARISPNACR